MVLYCSTETPTVVAHTENVKFKHTETFVCPKLTFGKVREKMYFEKVVQNFMFHNVDVISHRCKMLHFLHSTELRPISR